MKKLGLTAAFAAAVGVVGFTGVARADAPTACGSAYDFFMTACPSTWYGVTVYGTVDMGVSYQTHGSPFDRNFPTGASYFINKPSRQAEWLQAPNGLSQSNIGVKVNEPVGAGWSFVGQAELAFDPYSLLLANAPQALQDAIHVPLNQQEIPVDSSRWGWLAGQINAGFSSPVYGTVTFGRQNTLMLDGVNAYDPMGGSYAFSPIGFSGLTCGSGDTEECRWTTAIKYRENIGNFRLSVMGQPLGYGAYNPNNGSIAGGIGGDIKGVFPGVLSLDVIGSFDKDAVNIGPSGGSGGNTPSGMPTTFNSSTFLQATISNNTSVMALAKYTFGSFASAPPPLVAKGPIAPPPPPTPVFTLYAGYEWIQFANPSDPQFNMFNDGFFFSNSGGSLTGGTPSANATAINNNAYNVHCGTGGGCDAKTVDVMWVGAKYGITRDLDVIGSYYHYYQPQFTMNVGNVCANSGAHSQCMGTEDMWSTVLDWRFLPKWDAYIGTMFSQVNGGFANGYLARNNLSTTGGVRFRF
jgi:predicted porin